MPRLVAVRSSDTGAFDRMIASLGAGVEVTVEQDLASALARVREGGAECLLLPAGEIPPATSVPLAPESILGAIQEGIAVLDRELKIVWTNAVMRERSPDHLDPVGMSCYKFFHQRSEPCLGCESAEAFATGRPSRRVHQMADGGYWESLASPIMNELGEMTHVVIIARDVSERMFLRSKMESIYQAGNHLVSLDWAQMARMSLDERIDLIKKNIVSHTERLLKLDSLLVRQLDERTGDLKPIISVGHSESEDAAILRNKVLAQREGYGITGYVAATGHSYLCRNAATDPLIRKHTTEFGSQITVPLRISDHVIGTMAVRSGRPWAYTTEDMKFLEIFANFVSLALNTANLIRIEHDVTHGRIAERIAHEINNPINAVTNDVYLMLQEYIGHDSNTIAKLKDIEHNIDRVKEVVNAITGEGKPTAPVTRAEDPLIKGKRILVADDDEAIRSTMSEILSKDGCIVEVAADGEEAVQLIEKAPFDLVLSDIKMPKRDGYEIYSWVREKHPNMPVILMTAFGYDPNHSIVQARQKGLEVVLFKPFKVTVLRNAIRKALEAGAAASGPTATA